MFNSYFNELVKARLDMNIGCFILETIFKISEFDLLDAHSVILNFVPPNYVPSREAYCFF